MKIKVLLLITILCMGLTSYSSGWSCQKRYVNNKQIIKKHNC